jgi:hypothetical protein
VKAIIEVELETEFHGLVNEGVSKENLTEGFMVEFNHPKCSLGEIQRDAIDVSFGEIAALIEISPADLDFYGLELSDGMQAVKFSQPFLLEIEVEFEENTDLDELQNSLDLDWEIYNEEFELETGLTTNVNCSIRVI